MTLIRSRVEDRVACCSHLYGLEAPRKVPDLGSGGRQGFLNLTDLETDLTRSVVAGGFGVCPPMPRRIVR
jgi:hypothetical protein